MDADLEDDLRRIIAAWGSEQALYEFLTRQASALTTAICGANVPVPGIQVVPSFFAKGILGGGPRRSGEYEPASGDISALISLFPSTCGNEGTTRRALAHELIHHWEVTMPETAGDPPYPDDADSAIAGPFSDATREKRWRNGHPPRFIGKASVVAQMLGISLQHMLVQAQHRSRQR